MFIIIHISIYYLPFTGGLLGGLLGGKASKKGTLNKENLAFLDGASVGVSDHDDTDGDANAAGADAGAGADDKEAATQQGTVSMFGGSCFSRTFLPSWFLYAILYIYSVSSDPFKKRRRNFLMGEGEGGASGVSTVSMRLRFGDKLTVYVCVWVGGCAAPASRLCGLHVGSGSSLRPKEPAPVGKKDTYAVTAGQGNGKDSKDVRATMVCMRVFLAARMLCVACFV